MRRKYRMNNTDNCPLGRIGSRAASHFAYLSLSNELRMVFWGEGLLSYASSAQILDAPGS